MKIYEIQVKLGKYMENQGSRKIYEHLYKSMNICINPGKSICYRGAI